MIEDKKELVPLRINGHTTIWVKPEEATEEFAEKYRKRMGKSERAVNQQLIQ